MIAAVVLFLVGMTLGVFVGGQLLLPLLYGLPVAVAQVVRGNLRPMAVPMQLLAPVIGCVVVASLVFFGKLIAPESTAALLKSDPFTGGWLLGVALLLRGLFSTRTRADMWDDFCASTVVRFATQRGHAEGQGKDTEQIISKQEVDQIFAFTKAQWNERAVRTGKPPGRRLQKTKLGNGVGGFNSKTGRGNSLQPIFPDEIHPPISLTRELLPGGNAPRARGGFEKEIRVSGA